MSLTKEQLHENIVELKKQGAPQSVVEDYIRSTFAEKQDLGIDAETFKKKGITGTASRFLGIEKIGNFIGANAAKLYPQHRENLKRIEESDPEAARILSRGGDVTNRELVGSAMNLAGNAALPFAGKLLGAGSTAAKVGKGALTGAGFGTAGGLESGQSNSGVLLSAMLGAGVGAAIPAIGAMSKALTSKAEGVPEKLYNTIFKNSQDDVFKQLTTEGIKNIQDTDPNKFQQLLKAGIVRVGKDGIAHVDETLAKEALDRGLKGSLTTMSNQVVKMNKESELGLRGIVETTKKKIAVDNKKGLLNVLEGIRGGFTGQYDEASMTKQVAKYIKEVKTGKVSAQTLLDMRRLIDSQRIASTYRIMPSGKISLSQESYKSAADALRGKLNSIPGISTIMKDYSFSIEALEALAKEAQRKGNSQVIGMIDAILLGAGSTAGGPLIGAGSFLARRSLAAPSVATYGAQMLNSLGRATAPMRSLAGTMIEKSKPIARTGAYNSIGKMQRLLGN